MSWEVLNFTGPQATHTLTDPEGWKVRGNYLGYIRPGRDVDHSFLSAKEQAKVDGASPVFSWRENGDYPKCKCGRSIGKAQALEGITKCYDCRRAEGAAVDGKCGCGRPIVASQIRKGIRRCQPCRAANRNLGAQERN